MEVAANNPITVFLSSLNSVESFCCAESLSSLSLMHSSAAWMIASLLERAVMMVVSIRFSRCRPQWPARPVRAIEATGHAFTWHWLIEVWKLLKVMRSLDSTQPFRYDENRNLMRCPSSLQSIVSSIGIFNPFTGSGFRRVIYGLITRRSGVQISPPATKVTAPFPGLF